MRMYSKVVDRFNYSNMFENVLVYVKVTCYQPLGMIQLINIYVQCALIINNNNLLRTQLRLIRTGHGYTLQSSYCISLIYYTELLKNKLFRIPLIMLFTSLFVYGEYTILLQLYRLQRQKYYWYYYTNIPTCKTYRFIK